ncbi:Crp/Fnr family transcriptional regulator [Chryseobacterium sp. NRRL B-14859]|uniref:Crp/Fnr family transcriptional regulator n=1 Tax=Chryseobacterium sp. NRRL B-14859 TaxID=1562763 RepID=UPI003395D3A5
MGSEYASDAFFGKVGSLFTLTEGEKEFLLSKISVSEYKKDSYLIKPDTTAKNLFFLQKGLVRSFYQKDYREINTEFFFENEYLTAFTSFLTGEQTKLYFQCLEDCEMISIPKNVIDSLLAADPKWHILLNGILKNEYIKKCRRESSFLLFDSNERYLYFLEQFPESDRRIPLFHIASYLGISPETLSRIRSKKMKQIDIHQVSGI